MRAPATFRHRVPPRGYRSGPTDGGLKLKAWRGIRGQAPRTPNFVIQNSGFVVPDPEFARRECLAVPDQYRDRPECFSLQERSPPGWSHDWV